MIDFDRPVVFASDCPECEACGEPICTECGIHYEYCPCPGPHSDLENG